MIDPQFPEGAPAALPKSQLRQFAGLLVAFFAALFAWSLYRRRGEPTVTATVGLVLALTVGLPGLVSPNSIRPVFLGAMAVTRPIGHLVSTTLISLLYFGLLTPLALLFRLAGRHSLECHPTADTSYWEPKSQPQDIRRYLYQYQHQRTSAIRNQGDNHE
jgi:Saxitoxin biosynthesis operon protein SxtJ